VNRIAVLLAAGLAACATTDPPESEMAAARAMVAQARAAAQADAPREVAAAEGNLARAETAMQRGHYGHAQILARQAEADARLAYATSESARMQRTLGEERSVR
jgi:hypothetical protein